MVSSVLCICLCSYAAPGPTAAVTNRCNYTGSRVQCPPAAGAGAVAQFGGVSAAPSPAQLSPAQPSCPLLPVEEVDIGMIAIYRWTWSCLISTVDIYYLLLCDALYMIWIWDKLQCLLSRLFAAMMMHDADKRHDR